MNIFKITAMIITIIGIIAGTVIAKEMIKAWKEIKERKYDFSYKTAELAITEDARKVDLYRLRPTQQDNYPESIRTRYPIRNMDENEYEEKIKAQKIYKDGYEKGYEDCKSEILKLFHSTKWR